MKKKYRIDHGLVERLAFLGLINKQIAYAIGIPSRTFDRYIANDPKLKKVLKKGKVYPDWKVENSLYMRALGYNSVEYVEKLIHDKKTGKLIGKRPIKKVIKHVPGDVKAQITWLTNRDPQRWRLSNRIDANSSLTLRDRAELAAGYSAKKKNFTTN